MTTLPFLRDLLLELARGSPLAAVESGVQRHRPVRLHGLTPSAQMLAIVLLQRLTRRPAIALLATNAMAEEWRDTLATFIALTAAPRPAGAEGAAGEDRLQVLPAFELDPYEGVSPHAAILEQQALALWRASQGLNFLLLPAAAAALRLAPPEQYRDLARRIKRGDIVDLEGLAERLVQLGYQRTDPVEMPGQFSIRGGLLDLYSPEARCPVRLELLGDEIESLREFDPDTQRSLAEVGQTLLLPLTPLPLTAERENLLRQALPHAGAERAEEAGPPPGWQFHLPGLEGFGHSVLDLAPADFRPLVFVCEPEHVAAESDRWWRRLQDRFTASAGGHAPPPESLFFSPDELRERFFTPAVELRELVIDTGIDLTAERLEIQASHLMAAAGHQPEPIDAAREAAPIVLSSRPATRFHGAVARMIESLRADLARGERLLFLGANAGEVERLGDLFTEYALPFQFGVRAAKSSDDYLGEKAFYSRESPALIVAQGPLLRGFTLTHQHFTVYGSNDLFQQDEAALAAIGRAPARRGNVSSFLSDFRDLTPGDYVVHVEHGIGRYVGLRSFEEGAAVPSPAAPSAPGAPQRSGEFMLLEYAEAAKLYVPLTRMDLVQKYRSAEGAQPVLDRLGGTNWAVRKSRVKKAMKDMADELLKLYAARHAVVVAPAAPDGHLQEEFANAFPYAETEDQAKAIADVRRDLESSRPMDRLIVGDVGYGKTEVAMRAAFKMVTEGRQVAVLTPTTVLAFQHEQTFQQRFRAFPVTIELLSRFRSRQQQAETLEKLALGKVDIVIGTHRLLSKDVVFANLGLVVVDEEQRFGVRHKERLKQLKKEVHVLALSATPIPRTLNMSLAGLRDLSVIETPPRDRLAIQTVVAGWDENLIAAALRPELERGGQAYFVHNRVETIFDIAALLQRLVPEARIVVGHGQMGEAELEKVMLQFVRHEADILVSTTIIENGLDIPLANTMLVNRADRLGLSELYQLRGRVGRSNRRAYAYLLVPPQAELTPVARKRLAAMREFSDLGAGFKIAALDLELRGAGNLLGGEQSGNLDAVGFDLYVQMLEQTVRELRGEEVSADADVQLHMGLDLRIPPEYVPEEGQRLRMYKRLAEAETESKREDVLRELRDRYGPPPPPVTNLLAFAGLRPRLRQLGLHSLERRRDQVLLKFTPKSPVDPDRIARLLERTPGAAFSPQGVLKLPFAVSGSAAVLAGIDKVLGDLGA